MPLLIQTPTGPQVASEEEKAELLALLGPLPVGPQGLQGERGERGPSGAEAQGSVANNLTTTDPTVVLAAPQGVALKAQIDSLAETTSAGLQSAADATAAAQVAAIAASAPVMHTHTLLMTQTERDKLGTVAANATQNTTDAALRDRATHTGTQAIGTVSGLQSALDNKAALIGGKLDPSQVPDIAIQQYLGSVGSQTAMLALVGQSGDWCSRSDTGTVFVVTGNSAVIGGWVQLSYPASAVQSVCGLAGVVTLGQLASALASNFASLAQGAKADTALQPGVLPAGTTLPAAQISDAGAAGRTLLQTATMPEIQALVSGYVAVATFEDLLAARATARAGHKFICAAPVIQGGTPYSRWIYDGTEMRLDGPQDLLVDLTPAVGVLGTVEQFLRKYLLAALLFKLLRYTQVRFIFAKSGVTDAMSAIRVRVGTAGTSADLAVIGDTALTAPNRQRSIESVFSFPDANTMRFQLTQVAGFGGTAVNGAAYPQQSTIAAGYGSALYLSLTAQMAGSTDVPSSPSIIITAG